MNTNEIATKADVYALHNEVKLLKEIVENSLIATNHKPFLSGKEVKEMLGISEGTLKSYRAKGLIKAVKMEGKYFYKREAIINF